MKFIKIIVCSIFICLVAQVLIAQAFSEGINWYTYDKGMAKVKDDGKKIFLHFWASWCRYCKLMNDKTFKDPLVIDYLNKNFISIKVNADKNRKVAANYNVRGLPDNWFITGQGERIGRLPGYIPHDKMLMMLKYISTDSYIKVDFKTFSRNME